MNPRVLLQRISEWRRSGRPGCVSFDFLANDAELKKIKDQPAILNGRSV